MYKWRDFCVVRMLIELHWMSFLLTNLQKISIGPGNGLVQKQTISHYMNRCWPSSTTPYAVITSQWLNLFAAVYTYSLKLFITKVIRTRNFRKIISKKCQWERNGILPVTLSFHNCFLRSDRKVKSLWHTGETDEFYWNRLFWNEYCQ